MGKYRIVEVKTPYQYSEKGFFNFIPEIRYEYRYDIEYNESLFFGLINRWNKCGSFNSLKQAKAQIEFLKEKETWKVIYVE